MKQKLLLVAFILISLFSFAQVQGPPPPCGYFVEYACDNDGDGFGIIDLTEAFPFISFCRDDKGNPEDYYPITYYETETDMYNETNPISNPTAYPNIENPQTIYYRANKIVPDTIVFLVAENIIETKRLSTSIPSLVVCDDNQDVYAAFDLTSVNVFCGMPPSNYSIEYYETFNDANAQINQIANASSYISDSKTIYFSVEDLDTNYIEVNSFYLYVSSISINNSINLITCDDSSNDGVAEFDLTNIDAQILNGQTGLTISYHSSITDADASINNLPMLYTNVANPQTIYFRAENTLGCYNVGSIGINILPAPEITQPSPLEVCDDALGDGIETFDLSANDMQILDRITSNISVTYHQTENDALININSLPINYTNSINPEVVYIRAENSITGCAVLTTLDLVVKDCTNSGVIEVNAFHDADTNGTFETNENLFTNGVFTYEANNDGIQHQVSASTGSFTIISDDDTNTYDISYSLLEDYADCYEVTTTSFEDVSAANGDKVIYNFPITSENTCNDIAVYLVAYESPRPGFDYLHRLVIQNKGITPVASGSVQFTFDDLVFFNYVSGVDGGNTLTYTATGFVLDFVDLQPNQSESVSISMTVPISTSLGTLLTNTATYSVNDLNVENNASTLSEIVIGSYDPNDIAESHGPEILHENFNSEDYLYYTVRFQNVGTADAINVSIDNTLDSRLDKSTIQMLSSSHNNVFTRTDNQLNWQFDDIHLPSEDMDEPASHGYVYYKIKPMTGYSVGDIIPNTAEIYFDFNPAVITNTFETEFTEASTLSNTYVANTMFSIFPNPTSHFISLNFNINSNSSLKINIYDIQGKPVYAKTKTVTDASVKLDVSKLSKGLYFIKVNDGDSETTQKLVVK
ncbi:T9SS type A sorting domain-containing protein [Algibacter sp. R77976]|uniref:T9SS type A sorting domain-containing protein n=1 Tax=Algibacter sp. R77976 TaxID=3093873 RepID=UPI0037C57DD9